jgi:hypothetical protein
MNADRTEMPIIPVGPWGYTWVRLDCVTRAVQHVLANGY